jgi:hypothetical protein
MWETIITVIVVIGVAVYCALIAGKESDNRLMHEQVRNEAQKEFPYLKLPAALLALHRSVLWTIRVEHAHKNFDTEELETKLITIQNEYNRCIVEGN